MRTTTLPAKRRPIFVVGRPGGSAPAVRRGTTLGANPGLPLVRTGPPAHGPRPTDLPRY